MKETARETQETRADIGAKMGPSISSDKVTSTQVSTVESKKECSESLNQEGAQCSYTTGLPAPLS